MLAPSALPSEYAAWNRTRRAPSGRRGGQRLRAALGDRSVHAARLVGPYGWQANSSTRRFEYPWAYEQITALGKGLTLIDVGACLAGLQYSLAQDGHEVHAVDPGMQATGRGWPVDASLHQALARAYRAPVVLHPTTLSAAGLGDGSADVLYSISAIEHFTHADVTDLVKETRRILKPGGHVVLTIDLFLDLWPFGDRERNEWGLNVNVAKLVETLGAELVTATPSELYGFPDFNPRRIQSNLGQYMTADEYPVLTQCLVARIG